MSQLAAMRQTRGWSQAELARRAGMHSSTISLIESGRLLPGESQVEKIAKALGIESESLGNVISDARA